MLLLPDDSYVYFGIFILGTRTNAHTYVDRTQSSTACCIYCLNWRGQSIVLCLFYSGHCNVYNIMYLSPPSKRWMCIELATLTIRGCKLT